MPDLGAALGQLLPAALGVAISPLPIIATVLMLLSARAKATAPAFAAGWMLGVAAVLVVVQLVVGPDGLDTSSTSDTTFWIKLIMGVLFLLLALRTWQHRPKPGQPAEPPTWMATLDKISPVIAFGLGAALSSVNPKNLALAVTGGVAIASNDLTTTQTVVATLTFVVVASLLVAGPVIAFLIAGDRMARPLGSLKSFMEDHNAAIMIVLLTVLGLSNLGHGLGGLLA
jgi:threonine/homoserine/homoserine lactone efflux protein